MNIGENIRQARKKAGLSQKELGERMHVSQAMIAQYENGKRIPKYETLKSIAAALGVRTIKLFPDNDKKEWSNLRQQAEKTAIDNILGLLAYFYDSVKEVPGSINDSKYDIHYRVVSGRQECLLTVEDIRILLEFCRSNFYFFIGSDMIKDFYND